MKHLSAIMIFMAGVLWGTMGIFVRSMSGYGLSSLGIVGIRAFVTSAMIFIFLLLKDRKSLQIKLKDIWCFLGTGLASILFFNFCYFKTIQESSMAVAAVLLYTSPAIVMLLSRFLFGEKFTKKKLLALVLTFLGCICVSGLLTKGGDITPLGMLTGLGAGLGYALYSIFSRYAIDRGYSSATITFYTFLIAGIGTCFIEDMGFAFSSVCVDSNGIILCLLLGIVNTVAPYMLYTAGLKNIENGKASIIVSVEPVAAAVLGFMIYGEQLNLSEISGIIMVLLGVVIQ